MNIVFINGIQNTYADAKDSKSLIHKTLFESNNHEEDRIKFNYSFVWNPIGFYSSSRIFSFEDVDELFLLKTAEEIFADDFSLLIAPYFNINDNIGDDQNREISAKKVTKFIDDMTPNGNALVDSGKITDDDMFSTQSAINKLYSKIKDSSLPTIIIAHSQGNLLANLAYAKLISKVGYQKARKKVRIVNIANTALFSVHSLNFSHEDDYAIVSLNKLVSLRGNRTTPYCDNEFCSFNTAPPTFIPDEDVNIPTLPNHSLNYVYLSKKNIASLTEAGYDQKIQFTPNKTNFSDRFVDLVYAAGNSFEKEETNSDVQKILENVEQFCPSISDDGRYTAYYKKRGETENGSDIFVYDNETKLSVRASEYSNREEVDGSSFDPKITSNGEKVFFLSTLRRPYVVLSKDLNTGKLDAIDSTERATSYGINSKGSIIFYVKVIDGLYHILKYDLDSKTELVLIPFEYIKGEFYPKPIIEGVSDNGEILLYSLYNYNTSKRELFVYTLLSNKTRSISLDSSYYGYCSVISSDGDYIVYQSRPKNNGNDNSKGLIFLYDVKNNKSQLIGSGLSPSISGNGQYIVYQSESEKFHSLTVYDRFNDKELIIEPATSVLDITWNGNYIVSHSYKNNPSASTRNEFLGDLFLHKINTSPNLP